MKKLTEIKIRISEQDKESFRKACGRRGMSKTLQQFIKLHSEHRRCDTDNSAKAS